MLYDMHMQLITVHISQNLTTVYTLLLGGALEGEEDLDWTA